MTSTRQGIPAKALRLLNCPPLAALTADQARGAVCVWDAAEPPLTAEAAVDLGERQNDGIHWFLRACHNHTGRQAYRALLDHAPTCERCVTGPGGCDLGRTLTRLSPGIGGSGPAADPLDVETMREAVHRIRHENAETPTEQELETLILQLRGHIMLTIPEVEKAAAVCPEDYVPRDCALIGVDEARKRLDAVPRPSLAAGLAHAQLLARAVGALCDHYETLTGHRG